MLLGWEDGPTYIHLNEENGNLKYDPARSTPGKTFGQTTEVTLFSLQVEAYRVAALQYSIRDDAGGDFYYQDGLVTLTDEIAGAVSLLLHTVQWERLQAAPTGIHLGSFSFQDVFPLSECIDVYSGMRLVYGEAYEAKLTESQWAIICVLMTSAGDDRLTGSYEAQVDTTSYSLLMGEQYQFLLCEGSQIDSEYVVGFYSVLQNQVMVCYGYNGEMFALRTDDAINWRLLPGYNGIETFNIPDGSVFEQPIVDILPEEETPAA